MAIVQRLNGSNEVKRRLVTLGLTPGCCVTRLRTAPLGDPLHVSLGNFEVSLRRELAEQILVERA